MNKDRAAAIPELVNSTRWGLVPRGLVLTVLLLVLPGEERVMGLGCP